MHLRGYRFCARSHHVTVRCVTVFNMASHKFSTLLVVSFCISLIGVSTAQAADRGFSVRFSANDTGQIAFAANTLLTCPISDVNCAGAQAGGATSNNDYAMRFVDIDTDPTTFDSSSATLSLPAGATVLFAGLYWGADSSAATRGSVRLATPGTAYTTVNASTLDTSSSQASRYQGFADVTSQVQAAGGGVYTVANVQAATGSDRYAGWSLVVAYHDSTQPPRNLTVFDGLGTVNSTTPTLNIPVSGFVTPTGGPVRTTLGFIAWEGDRGLTGDSASLDSTTLTDAANPATNFFNSSISDNGVAVTAKTPNYANQLGFDADLFDADGILANGATAATIHLTTGGETYFPGVVTFATELFAPRLVPQKSASVTAAAPGDTITYTVSGTNTGQDTATGVVVTDPIPSGTTFVPGSLRIVASPGGSAGAQTDAAGDDRAEIGGSTATFRVGAGATAAAGGTLAPGQGYAVSLAVRIDTPTANGSVIRNSAANRYAAQSNPTFGLSDTSSPPTEVTVTAPDLQLTKTDGGGFVRGGSGWFDLTARNTGGLASAGPVEVSDSVPDSLPVSGAAGAGWGCVVLGQAVTCTRSDTLAAGAAYPPIRISVGVDAGAPGQVTNQASVAGGSDGDVSNNSASDTVDVASDADIGIVKSVTPAIPAAGSPTTFHLLVSNAGPSTATGIEVTDPIPGALTGATATTTAGSCTIAAGTLDCSVAQLAAGASFDIELTGIVDPSAGGTRLANTATVTSTSSDPDPGNNSSSVAPLIGASADLGLTKTMSPDQPLAGQGVTYTIVVTNGGPSTAHNVTVADPLPGELEAAAAASTQGTCSLAASGTVTCDVGTLAVGATATVTVTANVRAGTNGETLSNTATVRADEPDPNLTDNMDNVSARIEASTITATKRALSQTVTAGSTVSYRIEFAADGPPATDVTACDDPPPHTSFVEVDNATLIGGRACWTFARLAAGHPVTREVTLRIDAGAPAGRLQNLLVVRSSNAAAVKRTASVRVRNPHSPRPHGELPIVTG